MILFSFYLVSNTSVAYKQSPVLRVTLKAYIYIYIFHIRTMQLYIIKVLFIHQLLH